MNSKLGNKKPFSVNPPFALLRTTASNRDSIHPSDCVRWRLRCVTFSFCSIAIWHFESTFCICQLCRPTVESVIESKNRTDRILFWFFGLVRNGIELIKVNSRWYDLPAEDDRKPPHIWRSLVAFARNNRCTSTCTFVRGFSRNFCESFCFAFSVAWTRIASIWSIDWTAIDTRSSPRRTPNKRRSTPAWSTELNALFSQRCFFYECLRNFTLNFWSAPSVQSNRWTTNERSKQTNERKWPNWEMEGKESMAGIQIKSKKWWKCTKSKKRNENKRGEGGRVQIKDEHECGQFAIERSKDGKIQNEETCKHAPKMKKKKVDTCSERNKKTRLCRDFRWRWSRKR